MAKSVLIVDDSAVIRNSLCFLLENEGFEVQTAANGVEGLEKAQTQQFDTIIADINMPKMHGYDLIREIRKKDTYKDVPIIIITTEEEAIEYLIMKDCPQHVWQTWDEGNKPKMVICRKEQLPSTREWRNAWKIAEDINATDIAA